MQQLLLPLKLENVRIINGKPVPKDEIHYVEVSPKRLVYRLHSGKKIVVDTPKGDGLARAMFPGAYE